MEENNGDLRSGLSVDKAYVKFINLTNRVIEIVWINYSGQYERYTLLRNRQYVDINTYKSHPWIAMDVKTKDRMLLDKNYVYKPKPWREYFEGNHVAFPIVPPERRVKVYITIPVYSLRYRTLLQVRDMLKCPNDVDKLDLPNSIVTDLKKVLALRDKVTVIIPHS